MSWTIKDRTLRTFFPPQRHFPPAHTHDFCAWCNGGFWFSCCLVAFLLSRIFKFRWKHHLYEMPFNEIEWILWLCVVSVRKVREEKKGTGTAHISICAVTNKTPWLGRNDGTGGYGWVRWEIFHYCHLERGNTLLTAFTFAPDVSC